MRVTDIINESIREQSFDTMIKTKMFEIRKDHLDTIVAGLEAINGVGNVDFNTETQNNIRYGVDGRLPDNFQYSVITFTYHDYEAEAELSISGYSISVALKNPATGKREVTSQSKSFKLMISKMEKLYKEMSSKK